MDLDDTVPVVGQQGLTNAELAALMAGVRAGIPAREEEEEVFLGRPREGRSLGAPPGLLPAGPLPIDEFLRRHRLRRGEEEERQAARERWLREKEEEQKRWEVARSQEEEESRSRAEREKQWEELSARIERSREISREIEELRGQDCAGCFDPPAVVESAEPQPQPLPQPLPLPQPQPLPQPLPQPQPQPQTAEDQTAKCQTNRIRGPESCLQGELPGRPQGMVPHWASLGTPAGGVFHGTGLGGPQGTSTPSPITLPSAMPADILGNGIGGRSTAYNPWGYGGMQGPTAAMAGPVGRGDQAPPGGVGEGTHPLMPERGSSPPRQSHLSFGYPTPSQLPSRSGGMPIPPQWSSQERFEKPVYPPAKFDGTTHLAEYLAHFDLCARVSGWDHEQAGVFLGLSLTGTARRLLANIEPSLPGGYLRLRQALVARFQPPNQSSMYKGILKKKERKENECLQSHAEDIERYTRLAYPGADAGTIDIMARDRFVDSLGNLQMQYWVQQRGPLSLHDAVQVAIHAEACMKPHGAVERVARPVESTMAERLDKLAEEIRRDREAAAAFRERWSDRRGSSTRRSTQNMRCYGCEEMGHIRRECPKGRSQRPPSAPESAPKASEN